MAFTPLFELFTGRKLTGAVSSCHWFLLLLLLAPRPQCLPQFKREVLVMMVMMVMMVMVMMQDDGGDDGDDDDDDDVAGSSSTMSSAV